MTVLTLPSGGQKTKEMAQNIFGQKYLSMRSSNLQGLLGSHSIRKFAATDAHCCGISKVDKDTRGHWKGKSSVSDCYDDVALPYPGDCKVAEEALYWRALLLFD
jgi:hypothetical protein